MAKSKSPTETPEKIVSPLDKFLKDTEDPDGADVLASLLDETGDLQADFSMPIGFKLEVVAGQMVDHLAALEQAERNYIAARGIGDHQKRASLFQQKQYNKIAIAIIQREFPRAKALADEIMEYRVKDVQGKRAKFLESDAA